MLRKLLWFAGTTLLLVYAVVAAEEPDSESKLYDAIVQGKATVSLRYRYEFVDQDNISDDANASTLKLRLNYATGMWNNWSGFAEFDYIGELLANDFNSGSGTSAPSRNRYPVVADPKGADLNQFYFDYAGIADTRLRFGRQRILLDNQRFVGGVGWRQNEQTYDGVSVLWKGSRSTEVFYSYIAQVNRIFGERTVAGENDADIHLLNGRISLTDDWRLTPYAYHIDNDSAPAFSTATYGARIDGKFAFDTSALNVAADFASQSDTGNNPANFTAPYFHLKGDWALKNGWSLGLGFESLGGDQVVGGEAFRTPLATLHAFQGWADQFLTTPDAGIEDFYVSGKYKLQKWTLQLIYHDFSAAEGSAEWGQEFDLSASRSLGDHYAVLLKAAVFDADDASFVDTTKIWIQLVANY